MSEGGAIVVKRVKGDENGQAGVLPPELVETGLAPRPVELLESGERDAVTGRFVDGHVGMGGRPAGSRKAAALLDRSAPSLTQDLIRRSKKSDKLLAKAIDKVLPDAGRTDTVVSVSLTRDDVLAELRRRGIAAPDV